jgi:hypothetical protein
VRPPEFRWIPVFISDTCSSRRARIEWDEAEDGRVPLLVIDGQKVSWDELGRMLMSFEGGQCRAGMCDRTEEM